MYDYHHLPHIKQQPQSKRTLWLALIITLLFTIIEIIGGIVSNSLALLSDSAHMISDVLALGLSMVAIYMASRPPNQKYTFGYLRFEIIASFLNGLSLVLISCGIFIEGIKRFIHPEEIDFGLMFVISSIGLAANIALTVMLKRSTREEENLNVKSALWHFIGDLLSSIGVIISAILIYFTGLYLFDPLISLVIGSIIFTGGAKIIRESYLILMDAVPENYDLEAIRKDISKVEGVLDVHELHVWAISSDHHSLTAHIFVDQNIQPVCIILAINEMLKEKYGIKHSTVQIEDAYFHHHGEYGRAFLRNQKHTN